STGPLRLRRTGERDDAAAVAHIHPQRPNPTVGADCDLRRVSCWGKRRTPSRARGGHRRDPGGEEECNTGPVMLQRTPPHRLRRPLCFALIRGHAYTRWGSAPLAERRASLLARRSTGGIARTLLHTRSTPS